MTAGRHVVDDLSHHKRDCDKCRQAGSLYAQERPVGLCLVGLKLYERWRVWATSPD